MSRISLFLFLLIPSVVIAQVQEPSDDHFRPFHHETSLLGSNINTPEADFPAFRYATKLYFSRAVKNPTTGQSRQQLHNLLASGQVVPFSLGETNASNIAFASMTNTGERLYYTVYQEGTEGLPIKSEIFFRDKDFHGKWGPKKQLPRSLGLANTITSHPSVGILRDTRSDVLFFATDRTGGKGKKDIWVCYVEKDGSFTGPYNLPFNSPEDEVSPFFDIENQTLYFSSRGPGAMGGFDVFRSKYERDGQWSAPENLGRAINSINNEVCFSINDRGKIGYFASDRPNDTCPENEPLCRDFDIYQVGIKPTLQVFLYEGRGNAPLAGCNLELKVSQTKEIITTYLELKNNYASVGLEPGKDYELIISKKGYYPLFEKINADGMDYFKGGFLQLQMTPMGKGKEEPVTMKVNLPEENQEKSTYSSGSISPEKAAGNTEKIPALSASVSVVNDEPPADATSETPPPVNSGANVSSKEHETVTPNEKELKEDLKTDTLSDTGVSMSLTKRLEGFISAFDPDNIVFLKNIPQITQTADDDDIDLLFYRKDLQCVIALDIKNRKMKPGDIHYMNTYLMSVDGLLKKDQQSSIGISLFNGEENKMVVYSFIDGNSHFDKPSFINTYLFPEHYRGILPDPGSLLELIQ